MENLLSIFTLSKINRILKKNFAFHHTFYRCKNTKLKYKEKKKKTIKNSLCVLNFAQFSRLLIQKLIGYGG